MNNKRFASITLWILIGTGGFWWASPLMSPLANWIIGYGSGVVSCAVFYVHMELSK